MWRRTGLDDRDVTVIVDLAPLRLQAWPARLQDVVPGRSRKVLSTWLAQRDHSWRQRGEVVAMDGATGFKSATGEEFPQARVGECETRG